MNNSSNAYHRIEPPAYFRSIQERASKRWDQLEADPELAGPWHQLFKQVQSPRHILSELLQNADDAGASEARVTIEDDRFVFEHNGEDFIEAHFASICRFGYSNKRALHTIGFRGIGFKSTFSLGDRVELFTPSLAVAFERTRFTEPHWITNSLLTSGTTRIEVAIASPLLKREVEKNLEEWLKSPVSLLFFKKIRRLRINDKDVHWQSLGEGPIVNSEWMALGGKADDPFLLVRSAEESFPTEALDEIRKERMLGGEDSGEFPPCRVEIVLGAKGRLYVVLPTGVETELPFACNAPFIQDPARLKIKDPETSPTNRWLLNRTGELAANAMMEWLERTGVSIPSRADAYDLLPDVDREASTLEGACGAIVELAFAAKVENRAMLLTEEGQLLDDGAALIVPREIFDIWPVEQAMSLLDDDSRQALCQHISPTNQEKLFHWNLVEEFSKSDFLERLASHHLPRPATWRHLLNLWVYIAPEVTSWECANSEDLKIVPVQGKEVLYAASETVRLGEKKLLQSVEDWEFLSQHLIVLNQNWTRFLAEQRREKQEADRRNNVAEAAFAVLEEIGLDETSDVDSVIERVAADYFHSNQPKLIECIQLAQIAAKLGVTIGDSFRFATTDRHLHTVSDGVLFDEDGSLEELLPEKALETRLLHSAYSDSFKSCTREEWLQWVHAGRSKLLTFAPLIQSHRHVYGRQHIDAEANARGAKSPLSFPYVTNQFRVNSWDFSSEYWQHWESLSNTDANIWAKITDKILAQNESYWTRAASSRLLQVATTGSTRPISSEPLLADWLLKLRTKPCLPDTRNIIQPPEELVRRTPTTEALIDVEPFVHGRLDREATRPLLDLLGVRSTPSGPERLLDRLRALAKSHKAPAHEIEKWYRRLDQMLDGCSTVDAQRIKNAFATEKLILTQDGTWVTANAVFLAADEENVPGAPVIRHSVIELSLWHRIGIADRPSAELALQWLNNLTSESALAPDDARRVRSLLGRYPIRIWQECRHWISLNGEWVPVDTFSHGLSMQSLFSYAHLYDWVKRKTADFRQLSTDMLQSMPFSALPALSDLVQERVDHSSLQAGMEERRPWLMAFGHHMRRIELTDPAETARVRGLAQAITATSWIPTQKLEVTPYMDGVPAGTPRLTDILWTDCQLFVSPLSQAKLAKRVPEELGKNLSAEIRAALSYSFERSPADIKNYLEENFVLGPDLSVTVPSNTTPPEADSNHDNNVDFPTERMDEGSEREHEADPLDIEESTATLEPDSATHHEDPDYESEETHVTPKPRTSTKPPRPGVMARFALAQGYKAESEDRFFHSDGSWITRTSSSRFPWEHRTWNGEVIRHYYPKDHCLEDAPLQLEADLWSLLDQKPDLYSFILISPEGKPIEMTGERFRALRDSGALTIHPATYRLVYDLED